MSQFEVCHEKCNHTTPFLCKGCGFHYCLDHMIRHLEWLKDKTIIFQEYHK